MMMMTTMESEEEQQGSSQSEMYLVGFVVANIVGLKYYSGTISGREMVALVREPLNPYDPNAIKVLNTQTLQVGHLDRHSASVLAPLIDSQLITVEGIVRTTTTTPRSSSSSTNTKFRIPCQVHIFSHFSSFDAVKDAFSISPLRLISHSDPSFTLSDSIAVKETRATVITQDPDENPSNKTLDAIFHENLAAKNPLPEPFDAPSLFIKPKLLQHQREALAWLLHRECSTELPPFWERRDGNNNNNYVNVLTNYQTNSRPNPLRGGIFADDMGLGKTLTLLSLIAHDKAQSVKKRRLNVTETETTKATLVVCPPSVISAWINQLEEHTFRGSLKTYMYYGERRTKDPEELRKYDLVLTTYSTLGIEVNWGHAAAQKVEWWRVVLDEAHTIKNPNAAQSQAVFKLRAKRRWAVTGTPVLNGSIDLFALMSFLQFEPFSIRCYWHSLVQRHQGKKRGQFRLQALMGAIALRRTKDTALVGLPPKTVETVYVELSGEERQLYDEVKEEVKALLRDYDNDGSMVYSYSTMLSMILRLRQICTDFTMCPANFKFGLFPSGDIEDVSKNPELLQTLFRVLQDDEDFDCPICISPPTDIVITCCAHIFCRGCILKALRRSNSLCPLCRRSLSESDLFSAPPESFKTDTTEPCKSERRLSTKVSTLIKLLTESRDQNPTIKSVVFSQFRKMLLLLEEPLKAAGIKTLRLDGTMNAKHRARIVEQFQVSEIDRPMVLLASLRASSAGINLTASSRVYLMEPWWNPAIEEQAMDRVHRIGQKEAVKVVRLIAQNSIEERILMLQEKKKGITIKGSGRGSKDVLGIDKHDLRFVLQE